MLFRVLMKKFRSFLTFSKIQQFLYLIRKCKQFIIKLILIINIKVFDRIISNNNSVFTTVAINITVNITNALIPCSVP